MMWAITYLAQLNPLIGKYVTQQETDIQHRRAERFDWNTREHRARCILHGELYSIPTELSFAHG